MDSPLFLCCFDIYLPSVVPVPDMTYNVFAGTLNLALSIYPSVVIPLQYTTIVRNC